MWKLIPLSQYIEDRALTPEPETSLLRHLWNHYFSRQRAAANVEIEFDSPPLQSVPIRLLDWVAPLPDWAEACRTPPETFPEEAIDRSAAADALIVDDPPFFHSLLTAGEQIHLELDLALTDWSAASTEDPGIRVVLAAPHSGVHDMVRGWAEHHGHLVCLPTTDEQIWHGFDQWLTKLKKSIAAHPEAAKEKTRLVLIGLEQYFVREHNGLEFLRQLMAYLATEAPPSLIVCDSWAWAYLRDAIHLDAMVRPPLALARYSDNDLSEWLTALSGGSTYRAFTFRLGGDVLFTVGTEPSTDENPAAYQEFFDRLAEISRGNSGVAQALWRNSMSIDAAVDVHHQVQQEAEDDPGYTVWVQPLEDSIFPLVPATFTNNDAFILHTLLIHNGMTTDLLQQVLPLPSSLIARRLQVMRNANLTRLQDEQIEVTPLGYLPVRTFLREHGFFVDDL